VMHYNKHEKLLFSFVYSIKQKTIKQ